MDLIQENINNLTSLWRLAGEKSGLTTQNEWFETSLIPGSDWPNRLWFNQIPNQATLCRAIDRAIEDKLSISMSNAIDSAQTELLKARCFELKSELSAMFLSLESSQKTEVRIDMIRVEDTLQAHIWSDLFYQSFGYKIDCYTISTTSSDVHYYIAKKGNEMVGTAVMYMNKPTIAGIHSMGIIPSMRRKGYAEEALLSTLRIAHQEGANYATLQASAMGKGLYLKHGFQEQFQFKTFTNKTQNNNESNR